MGFKKRPKQIIRNDRNEVREDRRDERIQLRDDVCTVY